MDEIAPGLWHWTTIHERWGIEISSYLLRAERVVIDPRVPAEGLEWFDADGGPVAALLTNRHHYRDSGLFAERFGTRVLCNRLGAQEFGGGEPVEFFAAGDELPGGVRSVRGRRDLPGRDRALLPGPAGARGGRRPGAVPARRPARIRARPADVRPAPHPRRGWSPPTAPCSTSTSTPSCPPTAGRSSAGRRRRCGGSSPTTGARRRRRPPERPALSVAGRGRLGPAHRDQRLADVVEHARVLDRRGHPPLLAVGHPPDRAAQDLARAGLRQAAQRRRPP